jgi:hypothetical protein
MIHGPYNFNRIVTSVDLVLVSGSVLKFVVRV